MFSGCIAALVLIFALSGWADAGHCIHLDSGKAGISQKSESDHQCPQSLVQILSFSQGTTSQLSRTFTTIQTMVSQAHTLEPLTYAPKQSPPHHFA